MSEADEVIGALREEANRIDEWLTRMPWLSRRWMLGVTAGVIDYAAKAGVGEWSEGPIIIIARQFQQAERERLIVLRFEVAGQPAIRGEFYKCIEFSFPCTAATSVVAALRSKKSDDGHRETE